MTDSKHLTLLKQYQSLNPKQKAVIDSFVEALRGMPLNPSTIERHKYDLVRFLPYAPSNFNFKKATRQELEKAIGKMRDDTELGPEVKWKVALSIKKFYKWLLGENVTYPKQVAWIKTHRKNDQKVKEGDLLSKEEVTALINATKHLRNKAIIALLYDWEYEQENFST